MKRLKTEFLYSLFCGSASRSLWRPRFCNVVVIIHSSPATKYASSWPVIADNY